MEQWDSSAGAAVFVRSAHDEAQASTGSSGALSPGGFEDPHRTATDEPHVAAVLRDLRTLRAMRCYVMLLPARRWLSSEDIVKVARRAEELTYRCSTISASRI